MKKLFTMLTMFALLTLANTKLSAQICAANFTWTMGPNGMVTFTSTSAPTNSATTYYWNFGNNTTYTNGGILGQTASTTYSANGVYTVSLFFITVPTCSNMVTYTLSVTNATGTPCTLNANFNYTQGSNGLVNFNNITTGTITGVSYNWSFGDNSTPSTNMFPTHTYSANGTYVATLVATNNGTCVSTKTLNVIVNSYCNVNASFNVTYGNNGLVNFVSTSTGTVPGTIHNWNFGDASAPVNGGPTTSHTYVNGTYNARLIVMTNSVNPSCADTAIVAVTVTNATCNIAANFTYNVGANGAVTFINNSTGTNANTTYTWTFGNGFFSNAGTPAAVNYPSSGVYYVNLVIRNAANCTASITRSINVTGIPCVANANFTLVPSGTPQLWYAIPSFPWNVASASWSWGDNSVNTGSLYAGHQYASAGNYNICLTVTATCGATATACSSYSVFRGTAGSAIINVNVNQPTLKNLDASSTVGLTELVSIANSAVYPNPSTGLFNVTASGLLSDNATVTVFNTVGQVLYTSTRLVDNGTLTADISLDNAKEGIYFVKIEAGDKSVVNKLVISK